MQTRNGPVRSPDQLQIIDLGKDYLYGTTSYVASPDGARKLVAMLGAEWQRGPTLPIDEYIQRATWAGELRVGCVFPFVTTIDIEMSWESSAGRDESLDLSMLQRLIRYTFFVRRNISGYATPILDRVLARLPKSEQDEAIDFYSKILRHHLAVPEATNPMKTNSGIATRRMSKGERPLFTRDDAWFLLEFPILFLIAAAVPERRWHKVTFRLEQLKSALARFSPEKIRRVLTLVRGSDGDPNDALRVAAMRSEHHLQIIRDYFRGWSAPSELVGAEHVADALAKGHGAVLWVAHFSFNSLAAKKAFHQAGFSVSHLSRPEHGFSKSRFGVAFLNPLRVRAELRYLRDRIIIDRARPAAAVVRGQKRLKENGLISITAGAWEGARIATVNIHGCVPALSTGAPGLALLTGAALRPVFTIRETDPLRISVVVGKSIAVETGADRDERLLNATQEFADRMSGYVSSYPFQWRDWEKIRKAEFWSRHTGLLARRPATPRSGPPALRPARAAPATRVPVGCRMSEGGAFCSRACGKTKRFRDLRFRLPGDTGGKLLYLRRKCARKRSLRRACIGIWPL